MYFLLPTDAEYIPHEIPLLDSDDNDNNDGDSDSSSGDDEENIKSMVANKKNKKASTTSSTSTATIPTKKKKTTAAAATTASGTATTTGNSSSSGKKRPVPVPRIASSAMPSKKSKKKKSMTATTDSTITTATEPTSYATTANGSNTLKEKNNSLAKEMEALPVKSLLEIMNDAVSKGLWERKHQIIGSTLCYHAVRSAGSSKEIQQEILDNSNSNNTTATTSKDKGPGVSRTTIMEWIEHSKQYKRWVQQMLSNMEPRSYQASITKSLLKAGFSRTSGAGRYM